VKLLLFVGGVAGIVLTALFLVGSTYGGSLELVAFMTVAWVFSSVKGVGWGVCHDAIRGRRDF